MFQKKQIKQTITKEVITAYYSTSQIKEMIRLDAEKRGFKVVSCKGLPSGGYDVEAKEIPGFHMPKSVAETESPNLLPESSMTDVKKAIAEAGDVMKNFPNKPKSNKASKTKKGGKK